MWFEGIQRRNELTIGPKNALISKIEVHYDLCDQFRQNILFRLKLFCEYQINHRFFEWLTNDKIETFISSNTLIIANFYRKLSINEKLYNFQGFKRKIYFIFINF